MRTLSNLHDRLVSFLNCTLTSDNRASQVAQLVKNPPTMQETLVPFLGWEDPLEDGMTTHSIILAWRIPGTDESSGLPPMGSHRVGHD